MITVTITRNGLTLTLAGIDDSRLEDLLKRVETEFGVTNQVDWVAAQAIFAKHLVQHGKFPKRTSAAKR